MAPKTTDGYLWTPEKGIQHGALETDAVVSPQRSIRGSGDQVYDAIVIGAGYAGLSASRDLCGANHSVLLLEARDRIGGRTYTVKKDDAGFLYEMGGTWVTHHMGYLFREMTRYGLDRDLIETGAPRTGKHKPYYSLNVPGSTPRNCPPEEAGAIQAKAWDAFVNVDGQFGRTLCPLPHAQLDNSIVTRSTVEKWDRISCHERFEQIKHQLTAEEQGMLVSLLLHISGGSMENSSLWDMVRSHALLMHSTDNFGDVWLRYKLKAGQSELAGKIFGEAVDTGLQYSFLTPVTGVKQGDGGVFVRTAGGETFRAKKLICTVPLNVLKNVDFQPPLSPQRLKAINIGHVNHMNKIHADVRSPELETWNGMRFPGKLMYVYSDGVLPNGDVHMTGFGSDQRGVFVPEEDPQAAVDEFNKVHPMDIQRMVFHNWSTDPWSKGGPAWWQPGYMSKYQDELQSRHGDVFFASADWAHGWRAAIDGALEQGCQNALVVARELREAKRAPKSRL